MRLVVIGSGGRLGAALVRIFSQGGDQVIGFNHQQLDLASTAAIEGALEPLSFDAMINAAALTNVDYCETHESEALRINAEAPRQLAEMCTRKKARLVHISTDYVFDGEARTPYREEDAAEPISVYGASKRNGELSVLAVSAQHLVARVSWVFGPDRPSFIDGVLKRALQSDRVEAIGDKFAAPTYTIDIAEHLRRLLTERGGCGGLLHLCNTGECSWREYGEFAIHCAIDAGVPMKTDHVDSIALAGMKAFVAKRPIYTVLATDKLSGLLGEAPRRWQDAVEEFVTRYFAPAVRR